MEPKEKMGRAANERFDKTRYIARKNENGKMQISGKFIEFSIFNLPFLLAGLQTAKRLMDRCVQ
jgi:hypothetical protein